jgi:hypothetical protein
MASVALEQLSLLETSQSLSIFPLSKSISGVDDSNISKTRTSDASVADDDVSATPASLAADLIHYKVGYPSLP